MEFTTDEMAEISDLVARKRKGIEWVLGNQAPKDPERLKARMALHASILAKLGARA